jgi:hypothetical protein
LKSQENLKELQRLRLQRFRSKCREWSCNRILAVDHQRISPDTGLRIAVLLHQLLNELLELSSGLGVAAADDGQVIKPFLLFGLARKDQVGWTYKNISMLFIFFQFKIYWTTRSQRLKCRCAVVEIPERYWSNFEYGGNWGCKNPTGGHPKYVFFIVFHFY